MWKKIKEHSNYSVSTDGMVRNDKTGRILKPALTHNGYYRVDLNGKLCRVHTLVAETYIDNPNNYNQVNHIDGNKTNNNVDNLEWCTCSQNLLHAYKNGFKSVNYENIKEPRPILQLSLDGEVIRRFERIIDVERELGYNPSGLVKVCRGKRKTAYGYKWQYADL